MPCVYLSKDLWFPPVEQAEEIGLLAMGGDLSPQRLLLAYSQGIFPWYNPGEPILWWSPDPRCVLFPQKIHISRSLNKTLKKAIFRVSFDGDFPAVIAACRKDRLQTGTWITAEMQQAYIDLWRLGFAHSVECWHQNQLVGGLYGISLGGCFFGESMFSRVANASKVALVGLCQQLTRLGIELVDCQQTSHHLLSLGAQEISRAEFIHRLSAGLIDNKGRLASLFPTSEHLTKPS